jgi:predicted membrane protein
VTYQENQQSTREATPASQALPATAPAVPNEPYYQQPGAKQGPNRRALGTALVIIGLIWLLSTALPIFSVPGFSRASATLVDRTVDARSIVLDANSADVEVIHGDGDGIRVRAVRTGGSNEDFNVQVEESGDSVRVSHTAHNPWLFWDGNLKYIIELPSEAPVAISTTSGEVAVSDVSGGIEIKTISGDVELERIAGPITVGTTSGEVRLHDSQSTGTNVKTTSGDIELEGLSGEIVVESVSGEVDVRDAANGQVTISTTSGDIEYQGSLSAESINHFSSVSGTVKATLPEDAGLGIDASTISGDVSTSFDVRDGVVNERTLQGTVGNGEAALQINTTSGDIEIDQD